MKTERQDQIVEEIREIKRRLRLVERKAAALQKSKAVSPRRAFQKKYPHVRVDPRLYKLVGIDPPLSVQDEKRAIREAMLSRSSSRAPRACR